METALWSLAPLGAVIAYVALGIFLVILLRSMVAGGIGLGIVGAAILFLYYRRHIPYPLEESLLGFLIVPPPFILIISGVINGFAKALRGEPE